MDIKYGPYSPSRLTTATCPYLFHKTYIEKDPTTRIQGVAAARGAAVHEVLENMTKVMLQQESGKEANFTKEMIRTYVTDAIHNNPVAYSEVADITDMAIKYAQNPPPMLTKDAEVEARFAVKLEEGKIVECGYDDPAALARGRADIQMISDDLKTAFIYDHKTQPNKEEADTFQLGFYAWVMLRSNPYLQTVKTVLNFVRYGKYSEPYEWSRDQLDAIEDEVMTRIGIIESMESWDAAPYHNCQYCPVIRNCPLMKDLFDYDSDGNLRSKNNSLDILGNTAQAVKVAGFINVLDELRNKLTKDLKEHVKKAGVGIAIPGKVYEYRGSNEVNWDEANKTMKNDLCAIFHKYGIDPLKYMSFNSTASRGVWKIGEEGLVKELAEKLPRKLSTTFRGYKT